jgi:chaperonin GroEL
MNIVPMLVPMAPFVNSQLQFLMDLSAFTGARVFGLKDRVAEATPEDLGAGMESFEAYRFRSTIVGDPDAMNVEVRVEQLNTQKEDAEGEAEKRWIEERLGKITSGIAKLTISGGSNGELKEAHDRCEDAVCAVRAAIGKGILPGGCRVLLDLSLELMTSNPDHPVVNEILVPALISPLYQLLDNAGYPEKEVEAIIEKLTDNPDIVYNVETQQYGKPEEVGVFDSAPAVEEALNNATSIATVMGTIGGIVAFPRDSDMELAEAREEAAFKRAVDDPGQFVNEANERP